MRDVALILLVGIYGNVQSLAGNTLLEMVHALIAANEERAGIFVVFSGLPDAVRLLGLLTYFQSLFHAWGERYTKIQTKRHNTQ